LSVWLGGSSNVVLDSVYSPEEVEYDEDEDDEDDSPSPYPARFSAADLANMEVYDINAEASADDVAGLLSTLKAPKLKYLGLRGGKLNDEIVNTIVKSKLVAQVKTLDLSGGALDDGAVKALVAAKKQLAHLASIDLSDVSLPDKAKDKLEKALPNATVKVAKEMRPDFHLRYFATME
jgi:hypothetical protein